MLNRSGYRDAIPYHTSPPIIFTFQETAGLSTVTLGTYDFSLDSKTEFTPSRPIQANALYLFDSMSFSCDIDETDFFGANGIGLTFSAFLQSEAAAPAFREPITLLKYFNNLPYRLSFLGKELLGDSSNPSAQGFSFNRLLGNISGTLTQTPNLIGKSSVTGIVMLTCQEIVDDEYIAAFTGKMRQ